MDWNEATLGATPITLADAKGADWAEERRTFLYRNPISPFGRYDGVYSDVVLTACQNAMAGATAEAMALLRSLDHYDADCLEWLADIVRVTPMHDRQRRAMFYSAVKMAHAFLWAEAPRDD